MTTRPLTPLPAASEDAAEQVLSSTEDIVAYAAGLVPPTDELALAVADVDLVRVLTTLAPEVTVRRLSLRIERWESPHKQWHGRLGRLPGLLRHEVRYPRSGVGTAEIELVVGRPTPLATVARAIYPLFAVTRGLHGYGYVEIGSDALAPAGLALLPTPSAPGVPGLPVDHLNGVGLSLADYGLVSDPERFAQLDAVKDDPARTIFRHPLAVDATTGHLAVAGRDQAPLVDLNVHNPVGRFQGWYDPDGWLEARLVDGALCLDPTAASAEGVAGLTHRLSAPLPAASVRSLRRIESVDLSGLEVADEQEERTFYRRLAELAATGTILHSLPASLRLAEDVLGKSLAELVRRPHRPSSGLARELRSVPQRREAMERFGGFFELADHVHQQGHRLLPTVSAVLSTMRPDRVAAVIEALAAQRYPHLEIIVALHGAEGALPPRLEQVIAAAGAVVTVHEKEKPFGEVLADAARTASGDLVVKIDDDDVYGPQVISDLVLAHLYSGADMVGKTTEYLYLEALDHTVHRTFATEAYHYQIAGGAMMLSTALLNEIGGWRPTPNSTDRSVLIRAGNAGAIGYRTNGLGYVYIRHADGHTWRRDDSSLVEGAYEQWPRFVPDIVEG
ncbi:glycosyltransferase family 2 protein [Nocardioides albertanoniae]|uniref:glycosyltransferase family 2 protein n=1 Tax=Nocardioides albertanoniae TaxID=1175486 RepID=UPI00114E54F9|nr:glycosyltransferase [Nocardioides albertanoniae]